MCKASDVTVHTIISFVSANERFSFDELRQEIRTNGGIMQIGPGYKVMDFIADMQRHNELGFDRAKGQYFRVT